MADRLIYLDNAATSWPKPACVGTAMSAFLENHAGNPGRGGHSLARAAAAPAEEVRARLAEQLNAASVDRVVLTHGCTDSVNIAIHGVIRAAIACPDTPKPHVVTSSIEHNAVLRTLQCYVESNSIELSIAACDETGWTDPDDVLAVLRPETVLVCVSHASNATGTIQPIRDIGTAVRSMTRRGLLLVDSAQTIGHVGLDAQHDFADLISIAGHKGLLGPTGTGALIVGERAWPDDPAARSFVCERRGGTGAVGRGMEMPDTLPDALEAGTINAVGFAGLLAAMREPLPGRHEHEALLTRRLLEGLGSIPAVKLMGLPGVEGRTAVVLFTIDGWHPREAATYLDEHEQICVRGGTHCAPLLHERMGTAASGALRASPGWSTSAEEIDAFVKAIESMCVRTAV
ncbi:MAG: aminotransferase class V-fold PLP-dependent enzyme [Planctomycetota bacterium]